MIVVTSFNTKLNPTVSSGFTKNNLLKFVSVLKEINLPFLSYTRTLPVFELTLSLFSFNSILGDSIIINFDVS